MQPKNIYKFFSSSPLRKYFRLVPTFADIEKKNLLGCDNVVRNISKEKDKYPV